MTFTNFSEMIAEYDNVLDPDVCKKIIDKFEYDNRKTRGMTNDDSSVGEPQQSIKKSTDLWISQWPEWEKYDRAFFDALSPYVKTYLQYIKNKLGDEIQSVNDLVDSGYQIQRTDLGEGYGWHSDDDYGPILDTIVMPIRGYRDSGTVLQARRLFTYMFYLNDDFEGGHTQFRVGGGKDGIFDVKPKTGKLICFPASWYFHHRGDIVTKGTKYVCTGWLSDHVTAFTNDTTGISDKWIKAARDSGRKMALQFNQNTGRLEISDDLNREKRNNDTFKGMYPKLSELDTIVDESTQDRGI